MQTIYDTTFNSSSAVNDVPRFSAAGSTGQGFAPETQFSDVGN